jgi:CheY-like chemotaxis protein
MTTTTPDRERRKRALLIDDDASVRHALHEIVTALGFEADSAASGPEGLVLFARNRYDVVLTDLQMPGMSGWQVLAAVRRRDERMPVVIVTGAGVRADDPRLAQPGVALVRKPVDPDALAPVLARLLSRGS